MNGLISKLRYGLMGVIVSNFASQIITILAQIIIMPFYIRILGYEAFGIIAFILAVQSSLDMGLGASVNKIVAEASSKSFELLSNSLKTFEILYFFIAGILLILANPISEYLVNEWLKFKLISKSEMLGIIYLSVVMISLRLPIIFFQNVLRGLERHHVVNIVLSLISILRVVISLIVLMKYESLYYLFLVLSYLSIVETLSFLLLTHYLTSVTFYPKLSWDVLRINVGFTSNLWLASAAAGLLKQLDRIFLAGIVSLETVGVYATAHTAVQGIQTCVIPFFNAVYPRFTKLYSNGDFNKLKLLLTITTQSINILIVPLCLILIFHGYNLIVLITGFEGFQDELQGVLIILCLSVLFNAPMQVQLALALSSGRSHIPMKVNIIAILFLVPLMYWLIQSYGIYGAGVSWLLFNVAYFLIVPSWIMRPLSWLKLSHWYLQDNLIVMVLVFLTFLPGIIVMIYFDFFWYVEILIQLSVYFIFLLYWLKSRIGLPLFRIVE